MRILLVSDFYPPHLGGVEIQVEALAREFRARQHDVHVATVWQHGLPVTEDRDGVSIHRLRAAFTRTGRFSSDPSRRFHPPFPDPELAWRLRRLASRLRPDVIQAHGWIAYSCALATVGRPTPLILSVRDYGYTCPTRTMLLHGAVCSGPAPIKCLQHARSHYGAAKGLVANLGIAIGRPLLRRRIAAIHVVSRYVEEVVSRDLLDGADRDITRIADVVVAGGTTEPGASHLTGTNELPDRPYMLFVGALQWHKGLAPLLAAYRRLVDPPPLVLIGTRWPETPSSFPAGVTVITDAPHDLVMAAWRRALFGLAPSIWPDPLPGVVREAMLTGRPVIGTRVGGIVDMITDEETGLLVEPGDAAGLADAMQRLVDDPALRHRLGANAARAAAEFTAPEIATRFEELYRRVAHGDAPVRPSMPPLPGEVVRIHITGGSGTGKSTLARQLSHRLGIPAYHLDDVAELEDGFARRPLDARLELVDAIVRRPEWITDGIHSGWTEPLFREADLIVLLDGVGSRVAIVRVLRRFLRGSLAETRRGGVRHLFRFRSYGRRLVQLEGAIREILRYRTSAALTPGDAGSRAATLDQVRRHSAKVVVCQSAEDIAALEAELRRRRAPAIAGAAPGADA